MQKSDSELYLSFEKCCKSRMPCCEVNVHPHCKKNLVLLMYVYNYVLLCFDGVKLWSGRPFTSLLPVHKHSKTTLATLKAC